MQNFRMGMLSALGLLVASTAGAHGVHSTTGELTPAVKKTPWWHYFLSPAEAAAQINIDEADGYRYIKTDGLPNHATGQFPGRGNPHSIQSHERSYRVKLNPTPFSRRTPVGHNLFGVALNGVVFDAATAEYWNNNRSWNIEAIVGGINLGIDRSNAHVQPDGTYHYHGIPHGLLEKGPYTEKPVLLGYAADGFPIYGPFGYKDAMNASSDLIELKPSWRIKTGSRPGGPGGRYNGKYTADWEYAAGLGDLDDCNGRQGVTPEYPGGIYHYVITKAFPNIGRCWVGFPDNSFKKQRGGGGGPGAGPRTAGQPQDRTQQRRPQRGSGPGGPPQAALDACQGESESAACSFQGRRGIVKSQCMMSPNGDLACVPPHRVKGGGRPPQRQ